MDQAVAAPETVSLALTGSGGAGAITAGTLFLEAAGRAGWYGLMTRSVGPQIRGGEAAALLRLGSRPVSGHGDRFDVLVALDWRNVDRFAAEIPLDRHSLVIADAVAGDMPEAIAASGARLASLPFAELARAVKGGRANIVALGAMASLIGLPETILATAAADALGRRGVSAEDAAAAVAAGFGAAAALPVTPTLGTVTHSGVERWSLTGNQACGLGALRAGVRFVAAYPITPATDMLEWLAPRLPRVGGQLVQVEDEIAAINMIIGASYAGIPALTATSGPGLALMTEAIGLAVAAEVPVVIVDVMRGGPSTGIPTKSEQSDLNIALYGLHGDAPHLVLAPLSLADCVFTTQWAVHLAETLQAPAIVLSDQFLGQTVSVIERPQAIDLGTTRKVAAWPEPDWRRYAVTADGVSEMVLPGTPGGQHTPDGLEHDARGTPSSRAGDHTAQLDKRLAKLAGHDYGPAWAEMDGDGDLAVVTWGSAAAPVREAVARARAEGLAVRLVALRLLAPARPELLAAALTGVRRMLVVEQTHGAQFLGYLRAHYTLPGEVRSLARPGPLPIRPGEVHDALTRWS